jgi:hypothetical protein
MSRDHLIPKMHADEISIDDATVRDLLKDQFPHWALPGPCQHEGLPYRLSAVVVHQGSFLRGVRRVWVPPPALSGQAGTGKHGHVTRRTLKKTFTVH